MQSVEFGCGTCELSLNPEEAYKHFKQVCPQTLVACAFNPAHSVRMGELAKHLLGCPTRPVRCLVCRAEVCLADAHDQHACRLAGLQKQLEVCKALLAHQGNYCDLEDSLRLHGISDY